MDTSADATLADLGDVASWRARAEWFEITRMLDYRDAEMARTASVEPTRLRQVRRSAIPTTIAETLHLSEGQVQHRLAAADRLRDQTPTVWQAFSHGTLDWARVREIASTLEKLQRATSIHRLEKLVVDYASTHTVAELRQWLRRFVRRVEADLAVERAEAERRDRHVSIRHDDDSMGSLYARLPSHQLAAIAARLHAEARRPVDDDDDRTVAQREADLVAAWLLDADAATAAVDANIAVMVDADVLAGAVPGFAESSDGSWAVPASWIADVTVGGNAFWHRVLRDPVTHDVLAHEYLGRYAPDILAIALRFLHGTCQAPGCMVPAERCDQDHRQPWPHGPTRADNLGPLCRRHHIMKGHGVLRWTTDAA